MSAQASPTNSVANCTLNSAENDTLIAKVQLVGKNDLLYKKVRVSRNSYIRKNLFLFTYMIFPKITLYTIYRLEIVNEHLVY